ncbi:MAG: serine/threonine-protein kinase PknK [Deltaproteobacteria bacterium]|nr:MAG: serine/threonine-protein kinase PknK [Deltaproteobacteria bacterium]
MERAGIFTLDERLDAGAMGEVWLGSDGTHRVAVKVLTDDFARRPARRAAFLREAEAVARLDHPGVVRIFDVGVREDGAPWMAMELASGGHLGAHPPASWAELRALTDALLAGLAHVHARDLLHRDLKPANVILCTAGDERPGPKLADFGVSRLLGGEAHGGTLRYSAPEQLRGQARLEGPWTDLYALGCVVFELATGVPPFTGQGKAVAEAHLTLAPPRLMPRFPVPAGLEAWVVRLLAKDPLSRFRTAAEAAAALPTDGEHAAGTADPLALSATLTAMGPPEDLAPPGLAVPVTAVEPAARVHATLPEQPRLPHFHRVLRGSGRGLLRRRQVPLVGRGAEVGALWSLLREVEATGRRRVASLRGPEGAGCTRLASELLVLAREAGAAGLMAGPETEAPLATALGEALVIGGLDEHGLSAQLRARLGEDALAAVLTPGVAAPPAALAGALRTWSEGRVLVLVLDDVHRWPDGLRVLDALTEAPVLALLTHPLTEELPVDVDCALTLGALDVEHRGPLVEAALGLSMASAGQLAELGGGLPGWTLQLLDAAVAQGAVAQGEHGLVVGPFAPPDPGRVWSDRVDALLAEHPELSEAVELAAALGPRVRREAWSDLCGASAAEAERVLVRSGLALSEGRAMAFAHVGVLEALRERAGTRWAAAHARCLPFARTPAERARHLLASGHKEQALDPLLAAAHHAHLRSEFTAARHGYARWRRLMHEVGAGPDDPRWAPGLTREAVTWRFMGEYAKTRAIGEEVQALGRRLGDADIEADGLATMALADVYTGEPERGAELLDRAAGLVRDRQIALRIAVIRAGAHLKLRRPDEAEQALDAVADGEVPDHHAAELFRVRAAVAFTRGDLDGMESALHRAARAFAAVGDRWGLANTRGDQAVVQHLRGQFVEAAEAYRLVVADWRALGSDEWVVPASNLSLALVELGRWAEAAEVRAGLVQPLRRLRRVDLIDVEHVVELPIRAGLGECEAFDRAATAAEGVLPAHLESEAPHLAELAARSWQDRGDPERAAVARALSTRFAAMLADRGG